MKNTTSKNDKKSAIIIGSGFGGIGSAAILAKAGWDVTVLEKNEMVGGREAVFEARRQKNGTWKKFDSLSDSKDVFRFDRGPSWYLMPDVFEHCFEILVEDGGAKDLVAGSDLFGGDGQDFVVHAF